MVYLADVVKTGTRKQILEALRDYLADALDNCQSDRDRAPLSRQLLEVTNQLAVDEVPTEETVADAIAREAEERRAAATSG
jgi:hypothetical protein